MNKTIYNTYVVMESQEQCDRMKQLCLDNELKIASHSTDFKFVIRINEINTFRCSEIYGFAIWWLDKTKTQVTEQEFIELLKTTK